MIVIIIIWQGGIDQCLSLTRYSYSRTPPPPPPITVTISAEKLSNDPDDKKLLEIITINSKQWILAKDTIYLDEYALKATQTIRHTWRHTVVSVKDNFNDP